MVLSGGIICQRPRIRIFFVLSWLERAGENCSSPVNLQVPLGFTLCLRLTAVAFDLFFERRNL